MRKIISLFARNYDGDRLVRDEIVPGAEWVVVGKGIATEKIDGTACLMYGGMLFRRYDAKKGKSPPSGFVPAQPEPDPVTGHWPGWVPVGEGPSDQWHREALRRWRNDYGAPPTDWTYELIGPAIGNKGEGNPYRASYHELIPHGKGELLSVPRDFAGLRQWFAENAVEGIVWWRDLSDVDCDKVKIKRRDFGLPWPEPKEGE